MAEAQRLVARPEESIEGAPAGALTASYARLPPRFFAKVDPVAVSEPRLVSINTALADELGLVLPTDPAALAALFSGNRLLPGAEPVATAYAGHQFGNFVPQLGDGRAVLLGERPRANGERWDIQLKGSGRTPFSRGGDGRAALGPVLREYVVSEAMAALGIPTSRALAAVTTGETVYRDLPLPGGVVTRVAASHVRVGTFEYFAARGDVDGTRILADYVIHRHFRELAGAQNPYLELLRTVVQRQATLVAQWMAVGFIHGVMNTDNMAVSGHTIDFGPCAFMDGFRADRVFSSIDQRGRYSYGNQPAAAQWDLARFAETLLPLLHSDLDAAVGAATDVIGEFEQCFERERQSRMLAKLGIVTPESSDAPLLQDLLAIMHEQHADFTRVFRALCTAAADLSREAAMRAEFTDPAALDAWLAAWRSRLARDARSREEIAGAMRGVNPKYIPRNHRIEQVIAAAVDTADFGPFERLLEVLGQPFGEQPAREDYARGPELHERVTRTFCGT